MNFSKYLFFILIFVFFGIVLFFSLYFQSGDVEIKLISENINSTGIIKLLFNEPQEISALEERFEIKPDTPIDFIWSSSKKELVIVPLKLLENNQIYNLRVQSNGDKFGASVVNKIFRLFGWDKIGVVKIVKSDSEPNDEFYLVDLSEISPQRLPQSGASQTIIDEQVLQKLQRCEETPIKCIEINLSTQRMQIWENKKILKEYVISSGRPSHATKTGNFSILSKWPVAYGGISGQRWKMPFWMGIYYVGSTENGFHELPFINGIRETSADMGKAVSHGCVRLGIGDAEEVYNFADLKTPVLIRR
ncbi:MAG: L,D-transpeptidase [Patescibacteria group bacterium]